MQKKKKTELRNLNIYIYTHTRRISKYSGENLYTHQELDNFSIFVEILHNANLSYKNKINNGIYNVMLELSKNCVLY
jgi:hypothetical protein